MQPGSIDTTAPAPKFGRDYWIFLVGQTISSLGTGFTTVALPLLIFDLTQSPFYLGLSTAITFLPYLLFGLLMGAWVDRTNRKRLMIASDFIRSALILSIPLLALVDFLSIWYIYAVMFMASTLAIGFQAAQFAAITNLVSRENLVTANGRFQAGYSAAIALGPLLAGFLVQFMPSVDLLFFDAMTFLFSAVSLLLIKTSFEMKEKRAPSSIRQDIAEGLRFVLSNPVLRNITFMVMLIILTTSTLNAQIVYFAKEHFQASDSQAGWFYAAGGIGWLVFSLIAGRVRKVLSFSAVIVGFPIIRGILLIIMGMTGWYWLALLIWGACEGMTMISNIYTLSIRQTLSPNHLMGRVLSLAQVTAWSLIPIGTVVGGIVIERVPNVGVFYSVIGAGLALIGVLFIFSPLGNIARHMPQEEPSQKLEQARA